VLGQDFVAGFGEPGPVLPQAGQHGLIAIIEDWAAEPRGVTRARVVSDLLGGGAGGEKKKWNDEEKSGHPLCVLDQSTTRTFSRLRGSWPQRILHAQERRRRGTTFQLSPLAAATSAYDQADVRFARCVVVMAAASAHAIPATVTAITTDASSVMSITPELP
jgi:hypothetical protein